MMKQLLYLVSISIICIKQIENTENVGQISSRSQKIRTKPRTNRRMNYPDYFLKSPNSFYNFVDTSGTGVYDEYPRVDSPYDDESLFDRGWSRSPEPLDKRKDSGNNFRQFQNSPSYIETDLVDSEWIPGFRSTKKRTLSPLSPISELMKTREGSNIGKSLSRPEDNDEFDTLRPFTNSESNFIDTNDRNDIYQTENKFYYRGWSSPLMTEELHPLFRSIYETANENHRSKSRRKRFVRVLPKGSKFGTKWVLSLPSQKPTMYKSGYSLALNAGLPFPNFLQSLGRRKKRSLSRRDVSDTFTRRNKRKILKQKQKQKLDILSQVESTLDSLGLPARDCLTRLICELSEKPLLNGLMGEIVQMFFSFTPETNSINDRHPGFGFVNDLKHKHFLEAERHGKIKGDCGMRYANCSTLLEGLTDILY